MAVQADPEAAEAGSAAEAEAEAEAVAVARPYTRTDRLPGRWADRGRRAKLPRVERIMLPKGNAGR